MILLEIIMLVAMVALVVVAATLIRECIRGYDPLDADLQDEAMEKADYNSPSSDSSSDFSGFGGGGSFGGGGANGSWDSGSSSDSSSSFDGGSSDSGPSCSSD